MDYLWLVQRRMCWKEVKELEFIGEKWKEVEKTGRLWKVVKSEKVLNEWK